MGRRENKVEVYFKDKVKELGGICYKWVSPGVKGVPDQIAFIKGLIFLVEIKTEDGEVSPEQERQFSRLTKYGGVFVKVLYGHAGVDLFFKTVKEKLEIDECSTK